MPLLSNDAEITHPDYIPEVGKLCAAWSFFEYVTDRLLWGILNITPEIGGIICQYKDMPGRWSLIVNHSESVVSADEFQILKSVNKKLLSVSNDRNVVIHGQILIGSDDQLPYAVITRGVNSGKLHLLSIEAVTTIIGNIVTLEQAARRIANNHRWLETIPSGPIISDWPKPISKFP